METQKYASLLLRIGMAVTFMYAAWASFRTPTDWIGFFPGFLLNIIPGSFLLPLFSVAELILAAWLLSGKWMLYAALTSAALFFGIVVVNLGALDLVFRDVGLGFAAIALVVLHYKR